jgi:molybdopterin synthase sulfur carrier subunit
MATVRFTRHLLRFFPTLQVEVGEPVVATTVAEAIVELDRRFPGLSGYLLEDTGALRKHVNFFVDGRMLADRTHLRDPLGGESELFIVQALSGG